MVFGYDHHLGPELAQYRDILGAYGPVSEAVDGGDLHYLTSARFVCEAVQAGGDCFGVLCCATGIGVSIAANKFRGIYAARCLSVADAVAARVVNNANVLCLSSEAGLPLNREIVAAFVSTSFCGRDIERLAKIAAMELESRPGSGRQ
jgi:ribose 5-phosphate isomerase B